MDNVWYFAASCVFIFLFGNLVMLQSYHRFVENSSSSNSHNDQDPKLSRAESVYNAHSADDVYSIKQLSRELLANRNLFQQSHHEYFVMESRLRKLLENSADSYSGNTSRSVFSRYLDFSSTAGPVMLDCGEIDTISDREYVASGWTKSVFRGYYGHRSVALKTVDIGGQDVTACVDNGSSLQFCYHRAAQKIVKEIVLLQALAHDNVIQVSTGCDARSKGSDPYEALSYDSGTKHTVAVGADRLCRLCRRTAYIVSDENNAC